MNLAELAMKSLSQRMDTGKAPNYRPQGFHSSGESYNALCANCTGQCNCNCAPKCNK